MGRKKDKKNKKRKRDRNVISLAVEPWLLAVELDGRAYDTMEPADAEIADLRTFEASVKPGAVDVARLRQVVMSFFMDARAERAVMAAGESDLLAIYTAASTYYECRLAARLSRAARQAAEAAAGKKLNAECSMLLTKNAQSSPAFPAPAPDRSTMVATGGIELLAGHVAPSPKGAKGERQKAKV